MPFCTLEQPSILCIGVCLMHRSNCKGLGSSILQTIESPMSCQHRTGCKRFARLLAVGIGRSCFYLRPCIFPHEYLWHYSIPMTIVVRSEAPVLSLPICTLLSRPLPSPSLTRRVHNTPITATTLIPETLHLLGL